MTAKRKRSKPRVTRRYPLEALRDAAGCTTWHQLAKRLAVPSSYLFTERYVERGVSELVADRLATRLGLATHSVWPEMIAHEIEDSSVPCRECGELFVPARSRHYYCTSLCGRRARDRVAKATARRGESAEQRAARKAYLAAYRAAYGESLNRQRRARYRANREQELARQREYDATVRRARRAGQRVQREAATEPRRDAA